MGKDRLECSWKELSLVAIYDTSVVAYSPIVKMGNSYMLARNSCRPGGGS